MRAMDQASGRSGGAYERWRERVVEGYIQQSKAFIERQVAQGRGRAPGHVHRELAQLEAAVERAGAEHHALDLAQRHHGAVAAEDPPPQSEVPLDLRVAEVVVRQHADRPDGGLDRRRVHELVHSLVRREQPAHAEQD